MRFYTADLHLNNPGMISWFDRKFSNVYKMNDGLIKAINMRAKSKDDILIHVGDFCSWGNEKGFQCINVSPKEHLSKINATVILMEGNHDSHNKVKPAIVGMNLDLGIDPDLLSLNTNDPTNIKCGFTNLGKVYYNVSIGHYPSNAIQAKGQFQKHSIRICGHVHKAWKYFYDKENDVLNINVGCDVWRYSPVREDELINYIQSVETKLGKKWQ